MRTGVVIALVLGVSSLASAQSDDAEPIEDAGAEVPAGVPETESPTDEVEVAEPESEPVAPESEPIAELEPVAEPVAEPEPVEAAPGPDLRVDSEPERTEDDGPRAFAMGEGNGDAAASRTLATSDSEIPAAFTIWRDGDDFIKPVLQMSALLAGYLPHSDINDDLAFRLSTLALARFGFEGRLFGFLSFRSVFERNLGYSLARNGPVGTSVWEGTASLQARENYIRLEKWGLSLTGGILRDPATVDYISANVLDAFGMDPYVRDPLLVSGFSQGQGFMLRYNWRWLTGGVSFTAGNPLTSSLAFGFGGDVNALGTLFSAPLRALSNGIPGSDIQMYVVTPSVTFEHDVFDVKLAAQVYRVDVDISSSDDLELTGYNLRGTARVKLWEDHISIFAGGAFRRNEQLAIPDLTMTKADYEGFLFNGGFDFRYGDFGAGMTYYWIRSSTNETNDFTNQYFNLGVTYWPRAPHVSLGLRWARSMTDFDTEPESEPRLRATDSFTFSLRLLL